MPDEESIQLRVYGEPHLPTLIYLPGIHGDWTIVGNFRRTLADKVRFVEITYPRSLTWSLADYACAILDELEATQISHGWLLGESFGSQIVWALLAEGRQTFQAEAVILAGGFVRHPQPRLVRLTRYGAARLPMPCLRGLLVGYRLYMGLRFGFKAEVMTDVDAFIARRTQEDWLAAMHRLDLISANHPEDIAHTTKLPVYALTGFFDPVVFWPPVLRWLRGECPTLQDTQVIYSADHAVLHTAPKVCSQQILSWMKIS